MARSLKLSQVKKQVESLYHRLETQRLQIDGVGSIHNLESLKKSSDEVHEIESLMAKLKTEFSVAAEKPLDDALNELTNHVILKGSPEQLVEYQRKLKDYDLHK